MKRRISTMVWMVLFFISSGLRGLDISQRRQSYKFIFERTSIGHRWELHRT